MLSRSAPGAFATFAGSLNGKFDCHGNHDHYDQLFLDLISGRPAVRG